METLLLIAVVLITLAVVAQAGVLVAMYLMSRRITAKAESLMDDSRNLLPPLQLVASDLKTVGDDLAETGKIAREQVLNVQELLRETQNNVRGQVAEIRARLLESVDEARVVVMRPVRQYSAIAMGISEAVRTLVFGRRQNEIVVRDDDRGAA